MQDAIIGLDVGTTCTKAVLFDVTGVVLATAECAYGLSTPQPGWVEQDPEVVWHAAVQTVRAVLSKAREHVRPLALAVASQSGSLLPVRADGTPIHPFITWMDGRSKTLVDDWMVQGVGQRVRHISGWHMHPGLHLATLTWLHIEKPEIFSAAERWLSVNDFMVYRLAGQFCTNPSNGSVTQLMDIVSSDWSPELCALAGIRPEQLSTVDVAGAVIGSIGAEASQATELPRETLIVNGGHDQCCAALALGVMAPGQVLLACGTSWVMTVVVARPDVDGTPDELDLNFHTVPGLWTMSRSLGGLGASLEWLLNQCWQDIPVRDERYACLDREMPLTRPAGDSLLFLPITGGHAGPAGMQRGGFVHLQLNHSRASLARAVMEGAVFELRMALEQMRRAGESCDQLWMVGGATRSTVWPGIVADATRLPIRATQSTYLTATGAAMLAGWGAGMFPSIGAAQTCFAQPAVDILPDPVLSPIYEQHFQAYLEALAKL